MHEALLAELGGSARILAHDLATRSARDARPPPVLAEQVLWIAADRIGHLARWSDCSNETYATAAVPRRSHERQLGDVVRPLQRQRALPTADGRRSTTSSDRTQDPHGGCSIYYHRIPRSTTASSQPQGRQVRHPPLHASQPVVRRCGGLRPAHAADSTDPSIRTPAGTWRSATSRSSPILML